LGINTEDEGFGSFIGDNRVKEEYEEEKNRVKESGFGHWLTHFREWELSD